jgi:hypothetical protein
MGIKQDVKVDEFTCNGCEKIQYGHIGDDVFGIVGTYFVHTRAGGRGFEYFACSPKCQAKAIKRAVDERGDTYYD